MATAEGILGSALEYRLQTILTTLALRGYDTRPLVFAPPAEALDVLMLEAELGFALPTALRRVLLTVSAHVDFCWFAPQRRDFPEPFSSCFGGNLHWSLERLRELQGVMAEWQEVFSDLDDPYHAVWHQKLAFQEVGNGDHLALDLRPSHRGEVVYLSHDDGEGHGHVLAADFEALLRDWPLLACVGAEDWQWLPFTTSPRSGIGPDGEAAAAWRQLLGLAALR